MYYLLLDGAQAGPYSLGQIIEMWRARRVDALTLYWEEGNADWLPLHNIAPLLQVPESAAIRPPLPASSGGAPAAADEQVVWSGRPTLWFWTGELFWGALLSIVLIGIPFLIHVFWARNTTRFRVTTRRVSVEQGLFTRSSRELRIADIRSIAARANLFGIGDIEFSTAARADAEVSFWGLRHAERVRDLVKQLQNGQG
jgi:membrane protein YdbS with pleckstrin-like domain